MCLALQELNRMRYEWKLLVFCKAWQHIYIMQNESAISNNSKCRKWVTQPMNRGIEISSDVADSSRSLILDQVKYGVAVRMAVLYLATGGTAIGE